MLHSWLGRVGYTCTPIKSYSKGVITRETLPKLSFVAHPNKSGQIQAPLDKDILCYITYHSIKQADIVVVSIDGIEEEFKDAKPALDYLKLIFKKQKENENNDA